MKKSATVAMVAGLSALLVPFGLELVASDVRGLVLGLWPSVIHAVVSLLGAAAFGLGVQVRRVEQPRLGTALAGIGLAQWLAIGLLWAQLRELTADGAADAALTAPGPAAWVVVLAGGLIFGAGLVVLASPPRFTADQRFLRVWVQWNGQIVAERLFLRPATVTVGESASATFQLAASGLRCHPMLTPVSGHTDRYVLEIPRGVQANLRVASDAPQDETCEIQRGDSGLLLFDNGLLLGFAFAAAETAQLTGKSKEQRSLLVSFSSVATVMLLLLFGMAMTKPTRVRKQQHEELQDKLQAHIEVQIAEPVPPDAPAEAPPDHAPALQPKGKRAPGPEGKAGSPDKTGPTKLSRRDGPLVEAPDPRDIGITQAIKTPQSGALAQVLRGDAEQIQDRLDASRLGDAAADEMGAGNRGIGFRNNGSGGGGDGSPGQIRGVADQLPSGTGAPGRRPALAALGPRRPRAVPRIPQTTGESMGGCQKGDLAKAVRSAAPRIRSCYETQLLSQPSLAGKLTLQWTVGEDGRVRGDKLTGDTMHEPKVSDCVQRAIRSLRFVPPEAGTCVVSWPFLFSPG